MLLLQSNSLPLGIILDLSGSVKFTDLQLRCFQMTVSDPEYEEKFVGNG